MLDRIKQYYRRRTPEQEMLGGRAFLAIIACLASLLITSDKFISSIFAFYICSNSLLYWLQSKNFGSYKIRFFVALIVDTAVAIALLARNAETMPLVFPFLLWMTLGAGFRLGIKWLFIATTCSTVAFGGVVATSTYWQNNITLGYALTACLFFVPAYCTKLIEGLSLAREQAEVANRAKSYFLASISHELRTPLNAIIGYGNHMQNMDITNNQRDMVAASVKAGEHLLYLIDQLIQVGKSDVGKTAVVISKFKITDIIAEVRDIMSVNAAEKKLVLNIQAAPMSDQLLDGPADIIRVVLTNLIGNAIKFTEAGSVSVSAAIEKSANGHRMWIEVSDTGIGIAKSAHAAIFEPFQQADETVLNRFGGTGLGLAICKQMVNQIDGSITVDSEIGRGSIFRVELPHILLATQENSITNPNVKVIAFGEFKHDILATAQAAGNYEVLHKSCSDYIGLRTLISSADLKAYDVALISESLVRGISPDDSIWSEFTGAELAAVLVRDGSDIDLEDSAIRAAFATIIPEGPNFDELRSAIRIGCSFAYQPRFSNNAKAVEVIPSPSISRHILVADDNRTNRNVLAAILEAAGHIVEMVDDGDTALDALKNGGHDILLLDVNMPRLNGIEACRMWRQIEGGIAHLPIVGVTADATSETEKACLAAGMDLRLTKPINAKLLLETISQLCPGSQSIDHSMDNIPASVIVPITKNITGATTSLDADQMQYLHSIGDTQFVVTMIEGYFEDAQEMIVPMRVAADEADIDAFRFCAHGLKSSSNNIGAVHLAAICAKIERITESEFQNNCGGYLDLVEAELSQVKIELQNELQNCGTPTGPTEAVAER